MSAVAQLERDLIPERVKAGVQNVKAKGVVLGKPRVAVEAALSGTFVRRVSRILKLSRGYRPAGSARFFCAG